MLLNDPCLQPPNKEPTAVHDCCNLAFVLETSAPEPSRWATDAEFGRLIRRVFMVVSFVVGLFSVVWKFSLVASAKIASSVTERTV